MPGGDGEVGPAPACAGVRQAPPDPVAVTAVGDTAVVAALPADPAPRGSSAPAGIAPLGGN